MGVPPPIPIPGFVDTDGVLTVFTGENSVDSTGPQAANDAMATPIKISRLRMTLPVVSLARLALEERVDRSGGKIRSGCRPPEDLGRG
ncbi:hypothetical protein FRAHR75_2120003 [Frankia sp. Hr75.2]|nr:hypothetical protein FRAHR75_2120003 [Frankia sp. Hr75.2]